MPPLLANTQISICRAPGMAALLSKIMSERWEIRVDAVFEVRMALALTELSAEAGSERVRAQRKSPQYRKAGRRVPMIVSLSYRRNQQRQGVAVAAGRRRGEGAAVDGDADTGIDRAAAAVRCGVGPRNRPGRRTRI